MLLSSMLCLVLLVVPQEPAVDEIVKEDGTKLTGTLVMWNRNEVVFRTEEGEVRLAPEEISRITLGRQSFRAATARWPEPPPPPPAAEPDQPRKIWKGTVDFSLASSRGTTDTDTLVLDSRVERRTDRYRLQLGSKYFYATRDDVLAGNQVLAGGRLDRFFSQKTFVFGSADFEFDEVEKVDLRQVYAGGVGYVILDSEDRTLSVNGGVGFTFENFSDGTSKDAASGVFSQEFQRPLFGNSRLEQRFGYLQDLEDAARFKLRLEVGLRTNLNKLLSFRIGVIDAFDNSPRQGVQKNELKFTTGLGLSF